MSHHFVYQLRSCVWEITLACCFSCKYCGSRAGKARENELTTEECLAIAEQLADMGCRSYNYFTHGKMYDSLFCAKQA